MAGGICAVGGGCALVWLLGLVESCNRNRNRTGGRGLAPGSRLLRRSQSPRLTHTYRTGAQRAGAAGLPQRGPTAGAHTPQYAIRAVKAPSTATALSQPARCTTKNNHPPARHENQPHARCAMRRPLHPSRWVNA
jgi:hypothetical protein